ncbi:TPA: adenylosuccinate synthetase [Candidatus Woesearchaeota archaeon]|nr:adenylosuccinate synthetase [Candidatus Woesearchaeota archaeon]
MNAVVIGAYWGDEGKGKIVDMLAANSDWVARFNGGDNAGHTIVANGKEVVLHVVPAGMVQGKNVAIGPDVFFNPKTFFADYEGVLKAGFRVNGRILIDERAHVIMPYHIALDAGGEASGKLGTTKRGIGPVAKDKASRTEDITICDLVSPGLREKIKAVVAAKTAELVAVKAIEKAADAEKYAEAAYAEYAPYAEKIRPYVGSCAYELNAALDSGKTMLLEGAQSTLLDVVHGTRPYVTSSNCTAGGAAANLGIDLRKFKIIAVVKAYPTRVGEGAFPSELGNYEDAKKEKKGETLTAAEKKNAVDGDQGLLGKWIRQDGREFGATTGRPRRTGYPDFVALNYSAMINGVDEWAITKIDILSGKPLKAVVAYEKDGRKTTRFPFKLEGWKPVYGNREYFWNAMAESEIKAAVAKGYDALPGGMKEYIRDLVIATKTPVSMVSLSPEREITVTKDVLKRTMEYLR